MVMRGLPVPREKVMYIVKDAKREASRLGFLSEKYLIPWEKQLKGDTHFYPMLQKNATRCRVSI